MGSGNRQVQEANASPQPLFTLASASTQLAEPVARLEAGQLTAASVPGGGHNRGLGMDISPSSPGASRMAGSTDPRRGVLGEEPAQA